MRLKDTFRLGLSAAFAWSLMALIPALALPLWATRGLPEFASGVVVNYLLMVGVMTFVLWLVSRLEIDSGGIRLYRMQSLAWNEVTGVGVRRWFFLDYLRLERRHGRPFHVPLYFVGARPIGESLRQFAPANNPVQSLAVDQHLGYAAIRRI